MKERVKARELCWQHLKEANSVVKCLLFLFQSMGGCQDQSLQKRCSELVRLFLIVKVRRRSDTSTTIQAVVLARLFSGYRIYMCRLYKIICPSYCQEDGKATVKISGLAVRDDKGRLKRVRAQRAPFPE